MRSKKLFSVVCLLLVLIFGTAVGSASDKVPAEEREIIFVSNDGYTLYGTLNIPEHRKDEKLPAMLLVHGSGPNDRDETLQTGGLTLKPFKELAESLLKKGYIVLRYDKRSYTMLQNGYNKEEFDKVMPAYFINDARAAIDYLKSVPEVDQNHVILVGHSQGASFGPIIAKEKNLAGAVLLAPGLLPIREQTTFQLEYQIEYYQKYNQLGQFTDTINQTKEMLEQIRTAFAMADNGTFPEDGSILGASLPFMERWQELTIDVPKQIIEMDTPVLIVNGTTDMLCPAEILQEESSYLKEHKKDLQIVYVNNMIHQLYYVGGVIFAQAVPDEIDKWVQGLAGFEN